MRRRVLEIALCSWIALAALPAGAAFPPDAPEPSLLSASGTGEVTAPADLAYVRLGIETEGKQAEQAQTDASRSASKILAALKKLGVEDRDVQTVELRLSPVYGPIPERRPPGELPQAPKIVGYSAANTVRVTVRELARLGALVDAALAAGANRVDSIEFGLRDDREARKEALRRAVADARAKTAAMAEALGAKLGKVRALRENGISIAAPQMDKRAYMMAAESATPTAPGELVIRGDVSVEYVIE